MVSNHPDQRDRICRHGERRLSLLLSGTVLLGWLLVSDTVLLACELQARPGTEHYLRFRLDPHESTIHFEADARLHTFTGTAGKVSGLIRLPSASSSTEAEACVQIEASSLTTGIDLRDERMRRSHLHTDRFPTILFTMSGVEQTEPLGGDRYTSTLRGALTLHGVTRPLTAQVKAHLTSTLLEVEGKVSLRLSTYQIPIPSFLFIPMRDEVVVSFKVKAVRD